MTRMVTVVVALVVFSMISMMVLQSGSSTVSKVSAQKTMSLNSIN